MGLNNSQKILIAATFMVSFLLFFGFDYKPKNIKTLEKSRVNNLEATSIDNLLLEARKNLTSEQSTILESFKENTSSKVDSIKVEALKKYSSMWYEYGFATISAYFAEEVAKVENLASSWSIAGTTYTIAMKGTDDELEKEYARNRAIGAFESALSLEPEVVSHKINLALVNVESPPKDQPMKGILMLRDLNTAYPKDVAVMNQLARLALQTNQIDKAIERLETAISIESENNVTICLLAEAYNLKGLEAKSQEFAERCKSR
jgi:tetratricopeptide (TPR) repeat protein